MKEIKTMFIALILIVVMTFQPTPVTQSQTFSTNREMVLDHIKRTDEKIIITKIEIQVLKQKIQNIAK